MVAVDLAGTVLSGSASCGSGSSRNTFAWYVAMHSSSHCGSWHGGGGRSGGGGGGAPTWLQGVMPSSQLQACSGQWVAVWHVDRTAHHICV